MLAQHFNICRENEIKSNVYGLKNMDTGEQEDLSLEEIIAKFSK